MKKKGVSPVIATTLLIVIVIVIGIIIFLWARSFISEKAVKGDRTVDYSCQEVQIEAAVILTDTTQCAGSSAVDVNNIGNVPLYGILIKEWFEQEGELLIDQSFDQTIIQGESKTICLSQTVNSEDSFRLVPKLLAEVEGGRTIYTCPEKDGITITYSG